MNNLTLFNKIPIKIKENIGEGSKTCEVAEGYIYYVEDINSRIDNR